MSATYVPTENENPIDATRFYAALAALIAPGWLDKTTASLRVIMGSNPAVTQSGTWNIATVTNLGSFSGNDLTYAAQRTAWQLHHRALIT